MAFSSHAKDLAATLQGLYGDLLDLPLLAPKESAPRPSPSESLAEIASRIRQCQKCALYIGRTNLVFGRGNPQGALAFVGDVPSLADDTNGQPFSDEAGDLLHKMIVAMKVRPEDCYLANVFKCHPPASQKPEQELFVHCAGHLEEQFRFVSARYLVALGETAARALARSEAPLKVLRGQTFHWNGRIVFCTHHPRDLQLSPALKKEAWEDLKAVMRAMESER